MYSAPDMTVQHQIIRYVTAHRDDFEVSKFDGDIFWYNHIAFSKLAKPLKIVFFNAFLPSEPRSFWIMIPRSSLSRTGRRLYRTYHRNPELLRRLFDLWQEASWKHLRALTAYRTINRRAYTTLAQSVARFAQATTWTFEGLEAYLEELLRQHIPDPKERDLLMTPLYTSYVQQEREELIRIMQGLPAREFALLKRGVVDLRARRTLKHALAGHRKEWGWVYLNYASHTLPPLSRVLEDAVTIARNLKREQDAARVIERKRREKRTLLATLPPRMQELVSFFDTVIRLRDQRKAFYIRLVVPTKQWLKRVAPHYGFSFDDIRWLTWREQCQLGKGNRARLVRRIAERRAGCVAVYGYQERAYTLLAGADAAKVIHLFLTRKKQDTLKGTPVYRGKVQGKVCVASGARDFPRFQKGAILVTSHTTPDYVPLMKKAKAILTERGGITSHAAIVSREIGTPCIVGIKGLMGSLEDGDRVEVDANRGIVRKL